MEYVKDIEVLVTKDKSPDKQIYKNVGKFMLQIFISHINGMV